MIVELAKYIESLIKLVLDNSLQLITLFISISTLFATAYFSFRSWKATQSNNNLYAREIINTAFQSLIDSQIVYENEKCNYSLFVNENEIAKGKEIIYIQSKKIKYEKLITLTEMYENQIIMLLNAFEHYAISYYNNQIDKQSAYDTVNLEIKNIFNPHNNMFNKYLYGDKNNNYVKLWKLYSEIISKEQK